MPTPYDNTNALQQLQALFAQSGSGGATDEASARGTNNTPLAPVSADSYAAHPGSTYMLPNGMTISGVGSQNDLLAGLFRPDIARQGTNASNGRNWASMEPSLFFQAAQAAGQPLTDSQKADYQKAYNYGVNATVKPPDWMMKNGKYVALAMVAAMGGVAAAGAGAAGGAASAGSGVGMTAGGGALASDAALGAAVNASIPAFTAGGATAAGVGAGAAGAAAAAAGAGAGAGGASAALPEIVVTGSAPAAGAGAGGILSDAALGAAANAGVGTFNSGNSSPGTSSSPGQQQSGNILDGLKNMNGNDWLSTLSQLYGAYQSAQGASGARDDLSDAAKRITTTLGGSTITGPGGVTATSNPDGAGGTYGAGDLEGLRTALGQLAGSSSAAAQNGGLPPEIVQALGIVQNNTATPNAPDTSYLSSLFDQTLGNSVNQMNRGSVAPGLAATSFLGAGKQLSDASQGFGDLYNSTLANLRAQSQPDETRAYDTLQNDQFSRGQMGSSGGALQTEAFARGLGQADLSRQLAATQVAQQAQQNALQVGTGLANVGSNVTGLDESLLNSAFGRFSQTAGLSSDLTQQRFGNSVLLNNMNFDRSNTNLGNQITAAQLPAALQGSQLALALQALNGQSSINTQGLQAFQAALAQAQAGANARLGNGSAVAALAGTQAQLPSSSDIWGQVLTGIGNRIASPSTTNSGNGLLSNLFSGLFNKNPGTAGGTYAPDGTFYPG